MVTWRPNKLYKGRSIRHKKTELIHARIYVTTQCEMREVNISVSNAIQWKSITVEHIVLEVRRHLRP